MRAAAAYDGRNRRLPNDQRQERAMRDIIIFCTACEFALLGAAVLAGAPVWAMLRGAVRRGANSAILCSFGLGSWVLAGLALNAVVASLPDGGRFGTGLLRIGGTDFNLVVFVPMIVLSLTIGALLTLSLVAASRGLPLRACVRAATRISGR
jgi:hypothetical protein